MAIIHGGISRINIKFPDFDKKNVRFIAWGAGQVFRDFYPLLGIEVAYTICPIPDNQGKIINGIEVKPPEVLLSEKIDSVFIIIFSTAAIEIGHHISTFGRFKSIAAMEYGAFSHPILEELALLQKNIDCTPPPKKYYSEIGFFTQGPIFPFTEIALAYQRFKYPNDFHCFVTDEGQSPELLSKCAKWVDEVIEVAPPDTPGPLRRNYMIRTAKIAAQRLHQKGFKYTVRLRSGNIALGDIRSFIKNNFGNNGEYNIGKIGFHAGWTMRNIPFWISEAFMIARSEDMLALWDIEEDSRTGSEPIFRISPDMPYSESIRLSNEHYIWSGYAKRLGYANVSIEDSLNFMKDKLIPLEPEINTYFIKYFPLFSVEFDNCAIPDERWWNSIKKNFDYELRKSKNIYNGKYTLSDHFSRRIG